MNELSFLEEHPFLSNKLTIEIKPTLETQRWDSHIDFEVNLKLSNGVITKKLESFHRCTQNVSIDKVYVRGGEDHLEETYESEIRIAWENIAYKIGKILEENGLIMSYQDFVEFATKEYGLIED